MSLKSDGRSGGEEGYNNKKDIRQDRHTVSLLTDHLVVSPAYRGKVQEGSGGRKHFFGKERFTRETGFQCLKCGARGICGHLPAIIKPFQKKRLRKKNTTLRRGWDVVETYNVYLGAEGLR